LQRGLDEVWRVLKPGGRAVIMVYNALSYRRWHQQTEETSAYFRWWYLGEGCPPAWNLSALAGYDTNASGETAPATAFVSVDHLRHMCAAYSSFSATLENVLQEHPYTAQTREEMLNTSIPAMCGLDVYATLIK
jgi:ubiquinone/menaquinone biosynthesis C-methylase UbiE